MDHSERQHWRTAWSTTRWLIMTSPASWQPLASRAADGLQTALSAWNPGCRRLPELVNQARDRLLGEELKALGLTPQRVRGGDDAHGWWEDFWLIPHERTRDLRLVRRYGQLAGLVIDGELSQLLWGDGLIDRETSVLL